MYVMQQGNEYCAELDQHNVFFHPSSTSGLIPFANDQQAHEKCVDTKSASILPELKITGSRRSSESVEKKDSEAVDFAASTVETRFQLLLATSCSCDNVDNACLTLCKRFHEKVQTLQARGLDSTTLFLADFAVLGSRPSAFSKSKDGDRLIFSQGTCDASDLLFAGKYYVPEWSARTYHVWKSIFIDASSFVAAAQEEELCIEDLVGDVKAKAINSILENMEVLSKIVPLERDIVNGFLQSVAVRSFLLKIGHGFHFLYGLSSIDGTTAYLCDKIVRGNNVWSERFLVRELVQCIYRWNTKDPALIFAVKGLTSKLYKGRVIEPGDLFLEQVYGMCIDDPCPCCLNVSCRSGFR